MTFSFIVPTLGRTQELGALLTSLARIPSHDYEVIVVDQNPPGFLDETLKQAQVPRLIHLRVNFKGAARARNHGLQHAQGRFINFCDDDATVEPEIIETCTSLFAAQPECEMFTFLVRDPVSGENCWIRADGDAPVDKKNFHVISVEFAQVWRREALQRLGGYDTNLGVGTYYGADESLDLLIRALEAGVRMHFVNQTLFLHPAKQDAPLHRYYSYSRGRGRIAHLHGHRPFVALKLMDFVGRSAAGVGLYSFWKPREALRYGARLTGFAAGLLNSLARRHLD